MVDNLYFIFLDEIYSPNLNEFRNLNKKEIFSHINHLHFGINGIIVPASYLYDLYAKANRIKNRYFPNQEIIFHYTNTLNAKEEFFQLAKNEVQKKAYTASLRSFTINADFKFISVFVDKHELIKKYGSFDNSGKIVKIRKIGSNLFPKSPFIDYNLYLLCLRQILASFYRFISAKKSPARGIIVAEARGKREDSELRKAFQKIYYQGILNIQPTNLRRVIVDLFIVPKTQDYIGTQLADMIIYPTYDSQVPNHNARDDHFINFETDLKKKQIEKTIIIP